MKFKVKLFLDGLLLLLLQSGKLLEKKELTQFIKGDVENGKPNGLGVITFLDGSKFVGEYKDGENNGQGTFTFSWGQKYVGEWKDGENWNGIQYDKDGNIYGKYVNGEWEYLHPLKPPNQ